MKKWLKVLFALNMNATPLKELYSITERKSNKYKGFLQDSEIDLYIKKDLSFIGSDKDFVLQNLDDMIKENFADYDLGEEFLKLTNYEFISYDNYQVTLKFFDKYGESCLGKSVIKTFDVLIYNYDNFEKLQNEVLLNSKVVIPVNIVNLKEVVDYVSNMYKEEFNKIASENIYLNDEKDFFNYLSFFEIDDYGNLKAEFLGSNILSIPLYQLSVTI
ncbi:hypothetical protein [Spiroplasma tabanidicola]|uniref:Uncharacterized protein n=1 Tax=Spiroplasma tabanidicola TaxID=324079 RepID=A0A6I6CB99_9MOLU|nr:hypothetical protein [Spiroplasma tabanidicola]QGS52211.1 hypothetical protein STABA_v1c08560 [Spiroplasma tabanidicola]